jgi:hypothetical protein
LNQPSPDNLSAELLPREVLLQCRRYFSFSVYTKDSALKHAASEAQSKAALRYRFDPALWIELFTVPQPGGGATLWKAMRCVVQIGSHRELSLGDVCLH